MNIPLELENHKLQYRRLQYRQQQYRSEGGDCTTSTLEYPNYQQTEEKPQMTIRPEGLKYCPSHEWVHVPQDGSGIATVGISAFAVAELNDLVYMALPKVGQSVKAGEEFGEVESVKAVSPMYSPVSGEIVEVHDEVVDRLESLGTDPYDGGWLIKVKMSDPTELDTLLNFTDYQKSIAQ
jgi:glycine cleavage system H protein